jgi:3-hydroxybutyrate dehydrogenase
MTRRPVVLVTGGASGIGRACVERFARDGAEVVIIDLPSAAPAASELGARFVAADLSDASQTSAAATAVLGQVDRVDVLINNAGFQFIEPLPTFPLERWQAMLGVMLTAPFLLTQACWPGMVAAGRGRIVNIGSVHSLRASPFKVGYIAAKHGLLGLTRTAALEGGPHGITVNLIAPAYVRTPLVERQIADQARTRNLPEAEVVGRVMLEPVAIKRLVEPAEVAGLAAFLCSPDADAITGSVYEIALGGTAR